MPASGGDCSSCVCTCHYIGIVPMQHNQGRVTMQPDEYACTPLSVLSLQLFLFCCCSFFPAILPNLTCSVACQVLNISGSNVTGALPLTWGSPGALPALVELELGHNSITGPSATISLPIQSTQRKSVIHATCSGFPYSFKPHTPFFREGRHEPELIRLYWGHGLSVYG